MPGDEIRPAQCLAKAPSQFRLARYLSGSVNRDPGEQMRGAPPGAAGAATGMRSDDIENAAGSCGHPGDALAIEFIKIALNLSVGAPFRDDRPARRLGAEHAAWRGLVGQAPSTTGEKIDFEAGNQAPIPQSRKLRKRTFVVHDDTGISAIIFWPAGNPAQVRSLPAFLAVELPVHGDLGSGLLRNGW
jgi:hypothetical protein